MFERSWIYHGKYSGNWIFLFQLIQCFWCVHHHTKNRIHKNSLIIFCLYLHCAIYFHFKFWLFNFINFIFLYFWKQLGQVISLKARKFINTPKYINKRLTKRWVNSHWFVCTRWNCWWYQCIFFPLVYIFHRYFEKLLLQSKHYTHNFGCTFFDNFL